MPDFNFGENFKPSADRLDDIKTDRIARAKRSLSFHISFLDDIAIGIMPSDLIVIGAATGAGKTTLGTLLAENAVNNGTRVHYFALEAHEGEIEQRLLYRKIAAMCWDRQAVGRMETSYGHWVNGKCENVTAQFEEEARAETKKSLALLKTYYRSARFGVSQLVSLMASVKNETDLVVVDHLHFVDNDEQDENRGTKAIVKAISDAVRVQGTPVIAIAHLRKKDTRGQQAVPHLDDFHGSSDITKIATKAIVMAPVPRQEGQENYIANTYMRLAKDRTVGETGLTGVLKFDTRVNGYLPGYKLGRIAGGEFEEMDKYPWWAKEARRHGQTC